MKNASLPWPSSAEPLKTMERLNQDFLEFIGLLAEENVEYLIDQIDLGELERIEREAKGS